MNRDKTEKMKVTLLRTGSHTFTERKSVLPLNKRGGCENKPRLSSSATPGFSSCHLSYSVFISLNLPVIKNDLSLSQSGYEICDAECSVQMLNSNDF